MPDRQSGSDKWMGPFLGGTVILYLLMSPLFILVSLWDPGGLLVALLFLYGAASACARESVAYRSWKAGRIRIAQIGLTAFEGSGMAIVVAGMILLRLSVIGFAIALALSPLAAQLKARINHDSSTGVPTPTESGPSLSDGFVDRSRSLFPEEGERFWAHLSAQNF